MGSSNLLSTHVTSHVTATTTCAMQPQPLHHTMQPQPCLYTNLSKLDVTCEKTNKIDIDRYFQLMKDELIKHETPDDRYICRSMSSGKIERERKKKNSSSSRPKSTRKHSMDAAKSLVGAEKDKSQQRTRGYFSYDLSGQVVEVGEHKDDRGLSKQKSWDLSSSKAKGASRYHAFGHDEHLHRSHSDGDFSDTLNNNSETTRAFELEHHSRSMEEDLNRKHIESRHLESRHLESAHGKIYSVSEQNRRQRRKHFRKESKERRPSSTTTGVKVNAMSSGDDEDISLEEIFRRKLAISEPTPVS